jgi:hypothetical protein
MIQFPKNDRINRGGGNPMTRLILATLIAMGVSGCAIKNIIEIESGKYRLEYSEDPVAQPHSAASIFDWELRTLCPKGYVKTLDEVEVREGNRFFIWEVECK